jgi:hypothetical protein
VASHPPKGQKPQASVIYHQPQLRRYRRKNMQRPLLLKEEQLVLVSSSPNSLKKYQIKPKDTDELSTHTKA